MGNGDVYEYNCLTDNAEYALDAFGDNTVFAFNEVSWNGGYYYTHTNLCGGCSGGIKYWATKNAVVRDNYIHDNYSVGLWFDTDNAGALVRGNYIAGNQSDGMIYEISYNALIEKNTFLDNGWSASEDVAGNVLGEGVYLSQSGGDNSMASRYRGVLTVTENTFTDNWDGVVVYQNSNRVCSNNYTADCTLAQPSAFTNSSCGSKYPVSSPNGKPDYYDGCQWKAENVTVADNVFNFDPTAIRTAAAPLPGESPENCPTSHFLDTTSAPPNGNEYYCGFNGMYGFVGNYGPVGGTWVVENAIMGLPNANGEPPDNNHWEGNIYNGPWSFQAYSQGLGPQNHHSTQVNLSRWESVWGEDVGST